MSQIEESRHLFSMFTQKNVEVLSEVLGGTHGASLCQAAVLGCYTQAGGQEQ